MYCINTTVHVLFFLCTIDSSQQISDFFYKTLISMVDCHVEKSTKYFDQCGSHYDINTLYFGGFGQITDTITRFRSMNEMFWVSNYVLQTCNKVL